MHNCHSHEFFMPKQLSTLLHVSGFIGCLMQIHIDFFDNVEDRGRRENEVVASENNHLIG